MTNADSHGHHHAKEGSASICPCKRRVVDIALWQVFGSLAVPLLKHCIEKCLTFLTHKFHPCRNQICFSISFFLQAFSKRINRQYIWSAYNMHTWNISNKCWWILPAQQRKVTWRTTPSTCDHVIKRHITSWKQQHYCGKCTVYVIWNRKLMIPPTGESHACTHALQCRLIGFSTSSMCAHLDNLNVVLATFHTLLNFRKVGHGSWITHLCILRQTIRHHSKPSPHHRHGFCMWCN